MINRIKKYLNSLSKYKTILLILGTVLFELIVHYLNSIIDVSSIIPILIFIVIVYYINSIIKKKKINYFYLIFIVGVLLRTYYILNTSVYERQYDGLEIGEKGHLDYIYILFSTHHLPLTNEWQFYHPPLWHIIAATWLSIINLFKVSFQNSLESIQILGLLFSIISVIIVDKICSELRISDKNKYLIDLLFAVHPKLIMFSGQINNDCLLFVLESLIILLLIYWDKKPSLKNTILLALTTGLCVMTKLNGAIMAIPILYIFIKKGILYLKKKENIKSYIFNMITFCFISLPIGLWFQIRNIIKFSSNSIPLPNNIDLSKKYSIISRFLIIDFKELFNLKTPDGYYNIPVSIFRSSIFGSNMLDNSVIILLIINILLIIISTYLIIKYILDKNKNIIMNTMLITWITSIIMLIIFNVKYPYLCSSEFRYIVICLLPGIIIIGYYLDRIKKENIKRIIKILCYVYIVFSILYTFIY